MRQHCLGGCEVMMPAQHCGLLTTRVLITAHRATLVNTVIAAMLIELLASFQRERQRQRPTAMLTTLLKSKLRN